MTTPVYGTDMVSTAKQAQHYCNNMNCTTMSDPSIKVYDPSHWIFNVISYDCVSVMEVASMSIMFDCFERERERETIFIVDVYKQ